MIEHAIRAALNSEWPIYKVGAACFDKRKNLLSVGWNKQKTHVTQYKFACKVGQPMRQMLHAEIDALIKCRHDPYYLVVVRITKTGLSIAKPCAICDRAILDSGVRVLYYTNRDGVICRHDY